MPGVPSQESTQLARASMKTPKVTKKNTKGGPPAKGYNHLGRFATGRKRREATSYQ